jgi:hypothetical protein
MNKGTITSETPEVHWAHFYPKGKRVLDLGCGFWTAEERKENYGTPHHFIGKKPEFYMGVDQNAEDIKTFSMQYPEHKFLNQSVENTEQVEAWIEEHKITHLKADIEHAEGYIFRMPSALTLQKVAIETHTPRLHEECQQWIERIGMKVTRIDDVSFCPDVLVIYGSC